MALPNHPANPRFPGALVTGVAGESLAPLSLSEARPGLSDVDLKYDSLGGEGGTGKPNCLGKSM